MKNLKILLAIVLALLLCSAVSLAVGFFLIRSAERSENGGDNLLARIIRPVFSEDPTTTPGIGDEENAEDRDGESVIGGPDPEATEPSQSATPLPTPDIPPEICDSDPCTISVVSPPVEEVGSGDCARFTEEDVLLPILFDVPRAVIKDVTPEGDLQVSGTASVETPAGNIVLGNAELSYERYNPGLGGFETVTGRAEIPTNLMEVALLGGPVNPVEATIQLARGRDLAHLEAPLCPGRQYITFTIERNVKIEESLFQGTSIAYELEAGGTFIADPLDPSYQIHGDIPGVGSGGIGRSTLGLIPYTPDNDWGVSDKVIPFTAHTFQYVEDVDLPARFGIPLSVSGLMAVDLDPQNDSQVDLGEIVLNPKTAEGLLDLVERHIQQRGDIALGHSGGLNISIPIPGDFQIEIAGNELFDFDLVDGSTGIYVTRESSQAYFSGLSEQESIHPLLLLQPVSALRTSGYLSDQLYDFEIRQEGEYKLLANQFIPALSIQLNALDVLGSTISTVEGTHFQGTALSQIHPDILFEGQAGVEARSFFARPGDSFMKMSGNLTMPTFGVSGNSVLTADASGLAIEGTFEIDAGRIVQNGDVSLGNLLVEGTLRPEPGGYSISGVTSSQIHPLVSAGGQLGVQAFLATDPLGSSISLSGDMQVAGVTLGDAALAVGPSGVQIEGNYRTPLNTIRLAGGLTDAGPNLSGSTEVSLPLSQPAGSISGWRVEGQCIPNAEIRSCTISTILGSIDGIRHALTANICIPFPSGGFDDCRISTPAVSLGEVIGTVNLHMGIDGLGGEYDASFCPLTGSCQALTGGRLLLAAEPQACITVPVVGKEACAPF